MAADADADDEFDDPSPDDGGILSLPRLVFGIHAVMAVFALGIGVNLLLASRPLGLVLWGGIAGMIVVAGVAASRIAARR